VYLEKEDWNDVRHGSMAEVEFPKLDSVQGGYRHMVTEDKRPNGNKGIQPSGFMTGWLTNTRETSPALTAP